MWRDRGTQGEDGCAKDNGRDWRDASGNQGMPQMAENHQKLERG